MYLFLYCSFYLFDLNHALYHTNLNIIYNGQVILQNTGFAMLVREHNNFLTNVIALLIVTSTKSSGMLNVNLLLPCHFLNRLLQVVWRPSYYWCYEQHQFPRSRQSSYDFIKSGEEGDIWWFCRVYRISLEIQGTTLEIPMVSVS